MKLYLIIAALALVLIGFVYFSAKAAGKRKAEKELDDYKPESLPNSGMGLPKGWAKEASRIVSEINAVLKGVTMVNPFGKDKRDLVLSGLNNLTDDQFTLVTNVYNKALGIKNKETLKEAIKNEWGIAKEIKNPLLDRFNRLNLK